MTGRAKAIDIDLSEIGEQEYPDHPLFPLEDGDKPIEVSYIHVTRFEEGAQKYGPCVPASDLTSEQDIEQRWGGGQYIIIARAASKVDGQPGRFRKHRRIHLPGMPKPLSADPTPTEQKLSTGPAQASTGAPPSEMMGLFTMMLERERLSSERSQQQSQQFMQMFLAMMQGGKTDSQNMMQIMMQMATQQQSSMMQFISAMMANRGGGPEEMAKYAELLRSLGIGSDKKESGDKASDSVGSMLENAADVIQGIVALKGGIGGQPSQPIPTQEPAHISPTGGATSLLMGLKA